MFNAQASGYTGKQLESGFVGYAHEGPCFLVLAIEEGTTEELGKQVLENITAAILHEHIASVSSFEDVLSSQIFKQNLPAHFSLAAGYLYQDSLFVKTVGNGQIYFRRSKDFALLISGDKSAQGPVQEYDCAVFTTTAIKNVLGEAPDIQLFIDMNAPKDIVEKLQNEEYDEEERGFTALFAEFTTQPVVSTPTQGLGIDPFASVKQAPSIDDVPVSQPSAPPVKETITTALSPVIDIEPPRRSLPKLNLGGSKKIALALSVVLFGILLWSVVFGYQRRAAAQFAKKVEQTATNVDAKLEKAKKEAFLNIDTSLDLLSQAKKDVSELKAESHGRNTSQIEAIAKKISETEASIVKKEEKPSAEFYDLALEAKNAQGSSMNVEGNLAAILDAKNKTVYLLTIEKKSIEKYTSSEVADATLVALYDETIYFFSQDKGIYRFNTENKVKNLIKPDSDWGSIKDFEIFNGNFYLLDGSNKEIYKYVPTEDGYSEKSSYITDSTDISGATAIAIDSSVYVADDSSVKKFTRGAADKFETEFPDKNIELSGIYTSQDIEQVYTWDKSKSAIYVLEKDGGYIRQLQSSILKNASDFFVKGNKVYILKDNKIYTISSD